MNDNNNKYDKKTLEANGLSKPAKVAPHKGDRSKKQKVSLLSAQRTRINNTIKKYKVAIMENEKKLIELSRKMHELL